MSAKNSLPAEQRVLDYIRRRRLTFGGEKIVVAVSGGPDSVCLLDVLVKLRDPLGISLHIAHLDHCLRGKDSAADARYVAGLARRMGIPATIESRDVRAYQAGHRLSLEEAAREVRYLFFSEVASEVGADMVATGHTADDHIETVLMHLLRGSGTRGLRGLLPAVSMKPGNSRLTVIRPLLELARTETIAYCKDRHFSPRSDISNLSPELFRNRIRLVLLPELEKYNPGIKDALLRTSRIAADDLEFIESAAAALKEQVVRQEDGAVAFDRKEFIVLPASLKRLLIRNGIETLLGTLKDIDASHIEDIMEALDKPAGKVIGLPRGLGFTVEYDRFVMSDNPAALCPFPRLEKEVDLEIPGKIRVPGWDIEASLISPSEKTSLPAENALTARLDYEKTGSRLVLRRRKAGDLFQPLGMDRPKKLNRFMIDARIPRSWRDCVPVVSSPSQIVWVAGYRIDDRMKVTEETRRIIRLNFQRN